MIAVLSTCTAVRDVNPGFGHSAIPLFRVLQRPLLLNGNLQCVILISHCGLAGSVLVDLAHS